MSSKSIRSKLNVRSMAQAEAPMRQREWSKIGRKGLQATSRSAIRYCNAKMTSHKD